MHTPEGLSDYEQERGKPRPDVPHSFTQTNLVFATAAHHSKYSFVSELTLRLNGRRLVPDLCVYPKRPVDYTRDELFLTEPPLLAALISTTGQPLEALTEQARYLVAAGVQSCWLVQPAMQTITVYAKDSAPKTFSEGTLEDPATGIEVEVDEVFASA
jgi:Uma2 family endonuclease